MGRTKRTVYGTGYEDFQSGYYSNLLNQLTQQNAAGAWVTGAPNSKVRTGKAFSYTDMMNKQLEYAATQDERAYNEYLYNKYESPAAQVEQYADAGLNPALMYGSSGPTGSVNPSGDIDASAMGNPSQSQGLDIMSAIMNALLGAGNMVNQTRSTQAEVEQKDADVQVKKADAHLTESQAVAQDNENSIWSEKWSLSKSTIIAEIGKTEAETLLTEAKTVYQEMLNSEEPIRFDLFKRDMESKISLTEEQVNKVIAETDYLGAQSKRVKMLMGAEYDLLVQQYENAKTQNDLMQIQKRFDTAKAGSEELSYAIEKTKRNLGVNDDTTALMACYYFDEYNAGRITAAEYSNIIVSLQAFDSVETATDYFGKMTSNLTNPVTNIVNNSTHSHTHNTTSTTTHNHSGPSTTNVWKK